MIALPSNAELWLLYYNCNMQKFITTFLACLILTLTFGQTERKVSAYLLTQYNKTIYDRTLGNNPWGVGPGLQIFLNTKTKFKPTIELTGDIYLEDDKVLRLTPNGKSVDDIGSVVNLFTGSSFYPAKQIYLSFLFGPSFINDKTLLGIKPSLGFYFSKTQRWTAKVSYINIFNLEQTSKEDFGSISLAIGLKLF
jgi:hypothetical protein